MEYIKGIKWILYNIKIYLKLTQEFSRLNRAKSRARFTEATGPRGDIGWTGPRRQSRRRGRDSEENSFILAMKM